jgi:MSHA pilin protein MshA
MTNKQQGFTLIELVAVIVILGALAIVALPRFINLQEEADAAALDGVVGAAGSATAVNLAAELADDGAEQSVTTCTEAVATLQGGFPTGYTVESNTFPNGTSVGDSGTCTIEQLEGGNTADFTAYYVS